MKHFSDHARRLIPEKACIGVIKEVKDQEKRVALTPFGAMTLVHQGFSVVVERDAGLGASYTNNDYICAGATLRITPEEVASAADILVKVKEPVPSEFGLLKVLNGKTLFAFLHLADNPELAMELLRNRVTAVSYDTLEDENGRLPLLKPMSEIAGKFAVDFWKPQIDSGRIRSALIVGGGVTGEAAIRQACSLGLPDVMVLETNLKRSLQLEKMFYSDPVDVYLCGRRLDRLVPKADLIIGAVLIKGSKCPVVVTKEMILSMPDGRYITDVSIDQGGCVYGSVATSHSEPTFEFLGQNYCCIPNMPGQVPVEATRALTDATLPHLVEMATRGTFQYLVQEPRLIRGLNTHAGKILNASVARDLNMKKHLVELDPIYFGESNQ